MFPSPSHFWCLITATRKWPIYSPSWSKVTFPVQWAVWPPTLPHVSFSLTGATVSAKPQASSEDPSASTFLFRTPGFRGLGGNIYQPRKMKDLTRNEDDRFTPYAWLNRGYSPEKSAEGTVATFTVSWPPLSHGLHFLGSSHSSVPCLCNHAWQLARLSRFSYTHF